MQASIINTITSEQLAALDWLEVNHRTVVYARHEFPLRIHLTQQQVNIITDKTPLGHLRTFLGEIKLEGAVAAGINHEEEIWFCRDKKGYFLSYKQGVHNDFRCLECYWEEDLHYASNAAIRR